MMRSMFSAISGLKNHQTFMDVVANNIANVNTTGFKQQRVSFSDILSQTVRGASGPNAGRGGVNAEQIGTGVGLAGIDTIQTQGTNQATGKPTDMAIQGDGYFEMSDGKSNFFTRDGGFDLALDGTLVNPSNGLHVQGWGITPAIAADATTTPPTLAQPAQVNSAQAPRNITIPIGAGMTGMPSSTVSATGNLNSVAVPDVGTAPPTATYTTPAPVVINSTVYDAVGNAIPITLTATPTYDTAVPPNVASWAVVPAAVLEVPPRTPAITIVTTPAAFVMTFDPAGKVALASGTGSMTITTAAAPAIPQVVSLDLSALTQLASPSNVISSSDGASAGTLTSFTIGQNGDITGVYSNGFKQALGQIALATFTNPSGLTKTGGNLYTASPNSGNVNIGVPGTNGVGTIATGFLEGSNVDLAQQFTNMIMAERGFQANSKVITTSDEILQDLVNLKR